MGKTTGRRVHICEEVLGPGRRVFTSLHRVSQFMNIDRRTLKSYQEKGWLIERGGWVVIIDACELNDGEL